MQRKEFIGTIIRAGLYAFLAFLLIALGKKVSKETNCEACAGKGLCRGEIDCSRYISKR